MLPLQPPRRFYLAFRTALATALLILRTVSTALPTRNGSSLSPSIYHTAFIPTSPSWFGLKPSTCVAPQHSQLEGKSSARERGSTSGVSVPQLPSRREGTGRSMSTPSKPPRIIIAGAPASGKGTQCNMIKQKYGVVHLSTGDMLRAAVKDETAVGMKAKEYMNQGSLVPDEVIINMVRDRLAGDDCKNKGWLLDGFPRTRAQAEALEAAGIVVDAFIVLDVPDDLLISRIVGRRIDPETGEIYHLEYNPPPAKVMDRLVHRADDTAGMAQVRLKAYHSNIAAIKACYEGVMFSLDGAHSKEEVFNFITGKFDSRWTGMSAAAKVNGGGYVEEVRTEPIAGMNPGTSGLRRKAPPRL